MLSQHQTERYLERLGFDHAPEPSRENLDALVFAHQTKIPFETVGIHRATQAPDVSIDAIFHKIMHEGMGGYCFELNKIFQELLETLGYTARPVLSRVVRGRDGRMPINHRGIIVSIDGRLFSADVGFGGPMPAGALELVDGDAQDVRGEVFIAERRDESWWNIDRITQATCDFFDEGLPKRRHTELELCTVDVEDIDFDSLNHFLTLPGSLFKDHELVNLRTENGYKGYRDGVLTIREGDVKTVTELKSDTERSAALEEHFGLRY